MQYIINEKIIKSENAALSSKQTNSWIISYINGMEDVNSILDYGCGKLRYSLSLYEKCDNLVVCDSNIQLSRNQIINGIRTNIKSYIEDFMPNTDIISIDNIKQLDKKFDFVLCTNVLSAIPSVIIRRNVLKNIKRLLSEQGKALISVMYRNSYFSSYENNPNANKYLDGWIIKRGQNYSFYGIISPNMLIDECKSSGLNILNSTLSDGTIYLEVESSR